MPDILRYQVKDIDGNDVALERYRGQVLLFVNVASYCGFTPQYPDLEALHRRYRDRGFSLLAFPSNDFGAQEPDAEPQIKRFCETKYGVTFPLFAKVHVKGPEQAPLYASLSETAGEPQWNFHKYLVGRDGRVVRAFRSNVAPGAAELTGAIEAALANT